MILFILMGAAIVFGILYAVIKAAVRNGIVEAYAQLYDPQPEQGSGIAKMKCPNCARTVEMDSPKCPYCGHSFTDE